MKAIMDFFLINRDLYYHYISYNTFTTKFKVTKKITIELRFQTINTTYTEGRFWIIQDNSAYIHTGESKLYGMENKWFVLVNEMKQRTQTCDFLTCLNKEATCTF